MAPKFGTSGLRGLVTELTEALVRDYVTAFIAACPHAGTVYVGRDLRPSSPQIAGWVMDAVQACGLDAVECGAVPTPALALASIEAGAAAVMVTGSHIPADRNGLKFYLPSGEISKADEAAIGAALGTVAQADALGGRRSEEAGAAYVARYATAYGRALDGLCVGIYQHSSVARDLMVAVFEALGARAVPIAPSDVFIPVDTEALDPETQKLFSGWFETHGLDVLVSTDGDADRPMVVDDAGRVVPGDVLGTLTAQALGAEIVVTPVSSNSMVADPRFGFDLKRTKIGSPFVIAGMEQALAADPQAPVVGFEANGGFLLGFTADAPAGPLPPLMTRDCLLPIIAPLVAARAQGQTLSAAWDALPPVFTAADRLQGIETEKSKAFLAELSASAEARAAFLGEAETDLDETDGLRMTLDGGRVVHLRPSGNAPEFHCYAEAGDRDAATRLMRATLDKVRARLG